MKESIIKWQTGTPTVEGTYLVSIKYCYLEDLNNGIKEYGHTIGLTNWEGFWANYDDRESECYVTAWCKLSNVEPYRE